MHSDKETGFFRESARHNASSRKNPVSDNPCVIIMLETYLFIATLPKIHIQIPGNLSLVQMCNCQ
jgi:hypothetical protein